MQTSAAHNADIARVLGEVADLPDAQCRIARDEGVLACISSDARSAPDCRHWRYGFGPARCNCLEPADVPNTRPLAELQRLVHQAPNPFSLKGLFEAAKSGSP